MNESVQFFVKNLQQAYHIQECLTYKKLGVDIEKKGKVFGKSCCYKRPGGNWAVKEIGDTGHIIDR